MYNDNNNNNLNTHELLKYDAMIFGGFVAICLFAYICAYCRRQNQGAALPFHHQVVEGAAAGHGAGAHPAL